MDETSKVSNASIAKKLAGIPPVSEFAFSLMERKLPILASEVGIVPAKLLVEKSLE